MANDYNPQDPRVAQYQQQYQSQQPMYGNAPVPQYQPAQYAPVAPRSTAVSTGSWMISLLLASLPIVGFILLLVWSFSSGTNPSKSNWAKATLLWQIIIIAIVVILSLTGVISVSSLYSYRP